MPSKPCRNGASCEKPNCRFQHPPPQHEIQVKKCPPFTNGAGFTESLPNLCLGIAYLKRQMSFSPPSCLFVGLYNPKSSGTEKTLQVWAHVSKPKMPVRPPAPFARVWAWSTRIQYPANRHGSCPRGALAYPVKCMMYLKIFLFSVNLQDVLEAAETERGVYSSIPTKANQANPKERSRALRKINPNPKIWDKALPEKKPLIMASKGWKHLMERSRKKT